MFFISMLSIWIFLSVIGLFLFSCSLVPFTWRISQVHSHQIPTQMQNLYQNYAKPFNLVSSYGLFAQMTVERHEIIIEGSNDRKTWLPFEFKYKPGDVNCPPPMIAPYQPRLDWQMWFVPLSRNSPWYISLVWRLLNGNQEVLDLLGKNPFPKKPPKFIRSLRFLYRFTNFETGKNDSWWTREQLPNEYLPELDIKNQPLVEFMNINFPSPKLRKNLIGAFDIPEVSLILVLLAIAIFAFYLVQVNFGEQGRSQPSRRILKEKRL